MLIKKSYYKYCDYSETIRQMPQNYMLAHLKVETNMFIIDFDSAADKKMMHILLDEMYNHESKFCYDFDSLIKRLNSKLK